MNRQQIHLDNDELELLGEIESGEWMSTLLANDEKAAYQNYAKYKKFLQENKIAMQKTRTIPNNIILKQKVNEAIIQI